MLTLTQQIRRPSSLLTLLLLALVSVSCKDKTDVKADITGLWNILEIREVTTKPGSAPTTDQETYRKGEFTIDFRANGDVVIDGDDTDPDPWSRISDSRIDI